MKRLFVIFLLFAGLPFFSQAIGNGKVKKVVIDAGHGGNKPGAVGKKSKEKDIVLAIALKLGKLIEDNYKGDVEVVYTRTKDVDVDLFKRAQIANKNKADLFISIHANSSKDPVPTGTETWVMGLAKSSANLEVAKKENADILLEDNYETNYQGFDPNSPESHIMFALYQNAFLDKSLDFAAKIQKQFEEKVKTINRGVRQAEFLVLYKTSMPSVLIEVGFISNPSEEIYLNSLQGQGELAHSIFNAFREYKAQEEGIKLVANEKLIINIDGYDLLKSKNRKASPSTEKEKVYVQEAIVVETIDTSAKNSKNTQTPSLALADSTLSNTPKPAKDRVTPKTDPKPNTLGAKNLEYRIQILVSKDKLASDNSKFKGLSDIAVYEQNGMYRYTSGSEKTVENAKKALADIQSKGFRDAFIIAFYNNERITLQEALKISEQNK